MKPAPLASAADAPFIDPEARPLLALLDVAEEGLAGALAAQMETWERAGAIPFAGEQRMAATIAGFFARTMDKAVEIQDRQWRRLAEKSVATFQTERAAWARDQGARLAKNLTDDTRARIAAILEEAARRGAGPATIRREIAAIIPDLPGLSARARASLVASTELHNAAMWAQEREALGLAARGAQLSKVWTATGDNRTRPEHRRANGQVRDLNQDFTVGGARMSRPGDPRGGVRNVARCRCVCRYIPKAYVAEDRDRRARLLLDHARRQDEARAAVARLIDDVDPTFAAAIQRAARADPAYGLIAPPVAAPVGLAAPIVAPAGPAAAAPITAADAAEIDALADALAAQAVPAASNAARMGDPADEGAFMQRSRAYVLARGLATGNEFLTAFNPQRQRNRTLTAGDGRASSVSLPPAISGAPPGADRVWRLTHNHPGSSPLSLGDLGVLLEGPIEDIWAFGHDGSVYGASPGALDAGRGLRMVAALGRLMARRDDLIAFVRRTLPGVDSLAMSHVVQHVFALALQRAGAVRAVARPSPRWADEYARHAAAIDAAAATLEAMLTQIKSDGPGKRAPLRILDPPTHWSTDALRAELARVARDGDDDERGAYAGLIRFELAMRGAL